MEKRLKSWISLNSCQKQFLAFFDNFRLEIVNFSNWLEFQKFIINSNMDQKIQTHFGKFNFLGFFSKLPNWAIFQLWQVQTCHLEKKCPNSINLEFCFPFSKLPNWPIFHFWQEFKEIQFFNLFSIFFEFILNFWNCPEFGKLTIWSLKLSKSAKCANLEALTRIQRNWILQHFSQVFPSFLN